MHDDVIDIVHAEDLEPGDLTRYGEVLSVEEDGEDFVLVTTDSEDEPVRLRWDRMVSLYGDIVSDEF